MQERIADNSAMHRTFLEALVERLTPEVGHIGWSAFATYEGEGDAQLTELLQTGMANLARARLRAIDALASGRLEAMRVALPCCLDEERLGRRVAAEFAETIGRNKLLAGRQMGGIKQGKRSQADAEARWDRWTRRFCELRGQGLTAWRARFRVRKEMEIAGMLVTDRTLRRRLRDD